MKRILIFHMISYYFIFYIMNHFLFIVLYHLHSAGRRPASGPGLVWGGGARGALWPQQLHHLHSAGHCPTSGSGRVWGGGARGAHRLRELHLLR